MLPEICLQLMYYVAAIIYATVAVTLVLSYLGFNFLSVFHNFFVVCW